MRNWAYTGVYNDSYYVKTLKLDLVFTACSNKVCPKKIVIILESTNSRNKVLNVQLIHIPAPNSGYLYKFWERCEVSCEGVVKVWTAH